MDLCACESEEREHGVGDRVNANIMSDVLFSIGRSPRSGAETQMSIVTQYQRACISLCTAAQAPCQRYCNLNLSTHEKHIFLDVPPELFSPCMCRMSASVRNDDSFILHAKQSIVKQR